MDALQSLYAVLVIFVGLVHYSISDNEYMISTPDPITITPDVETTLLCEMNIEPDKFEWKFYPLPLTEVSNPLAEIDLNNPDFHLLNNFDSSKGQSRLSIQANRGERVAGDYQCLAYYGASVVASVPWRITMAMLGQFPQQANATIRVVAGNTVNWKCDPPPSNPQPYIDYYKNNNYTLPYQSISKKSLIIPNVGLADSGQYSCQVTNNQIKSMNSLAVLNLSVVSYLLPQKPQFIVPLQQNYSVTKGDSVLLECSAIGNPRPEVIWERQSGIIEERRAKMLESGLRINNVQLSDGGVYVCRSKNQEGSISHEIKLNVNEPPAIDCIENNFDDVKQGERLEISCTVTGHPKPKISWFLNGFSVHNDSAIVAKDNTILFKRVEKRHAGNLQIFARNVVKTNYSLVYIKVFPISTTIDISTTPPQPYHKIHKNNGGRKPMKQTPMIPPSKPTVTRVNDQSVMVRWSVSLNKGLPIQFFKVQYREVSPHGKTKGSKWNTANADIPPHVTSYEVTNLKPEHCYRFRIAAVYSNNDNKLSNTSEKFVLKAYDFDNRNPLPIPLITTTETIDSTSVKIYWKCDKHQNISIEGFVINYNSASSAADYLKVTVDGENTTSFILDHLQPDTIYDIKLQSFTSKSASEFSAIMKGKTLPDPKTSTTTLKSVIEPSSSDNNGISYKLYAIIACTVIGGVGTIVVIGLLLFCRKWKQKKHNNRGDRDKPAVDDHHIQVEGNEYVVGPKNPPRANGTANRITITPNPLADADNKNQNMIEMSCLSSQNNNCATSPATTVAGADEPTSSSSASSTKDVRNNRKHEKLIRNAHNLDNTVAATASGENYV